MPRFASPAQRLLEARSANPRPPKPIRSVLAACGRPLFCGPFGFVLACGRALRHNRSDLSGTMMAKLYFSYAAMNAGKSTLLLQAAYNYRERGMRPLLYTSALYAEGGVGLITSRIGIAEAAELYAPGDDLYQSVRDFHEESRVDCVFVDEAQFLTREQVWQLARVGDRLHIPVMCYGLRTDFQGKLFPGSMELLAIADSLREIRTICTCGAKATMVVRQDMSGRVLTDGDQVSIEKSVYLSLCRKHWEEAVGRWPVKGP